MGLIIGFDLYEKEPLDKRGEWVMVKEDDEADLRYCYGRTNATQSWGVLFDNDTVPVFQEKLDGRQFIKDGEVLEQYVLRNFTDFKEVVLDACEDDIANGNKERQALLAQSWDNEKEIKELRQLQMQCTKEQSYAFDRWAEKIQDLKETNRQLQNEYRDFEEEDYNTNRALRVKEMVERMEKLLKEDKYYIVPFYSY